MSGSATIITHPIALCSYVLSLVFGLLAKRWKARNQREEDRNLFRLAASLAAVALIGGLFLAWRQEAPKSAPAGAPAAQIQISNGGQSPNVSGAKDVTINYGNSAPAAADGKEKK
jgi:H+/Cl- antiporter ClcA